MTHLLPLVAPWLLGALLLALDGRRTWVVGGAAIALLALAIGDGILLAQALAPEQTPFEVVTGGWPEGVGIRLRVDPMGLFFATLSTAVLGGVLVHEARAEVRSRLFPAFIAFLGAGLTGAFFTADLFNFYVFFELSVVTSFALASYGYGRAEVRGAFTYVATNLVGSVLFLIGVAAIYHATGTLDFDQVAARAGGDDVDTLILPACLLFVGLSVKLGLFPFHGWVTVLYSHARPAVAAALGGALANVGAYGLLRLGFSVLEPAREASAVPLIVLGLAATLYGSLVALHRKKPSAVASYTAIVHAGYLVLAIGVGGVHGVAAVLLTVLAGSIDKPILFLTADSGGSVRCGISLVGAASLAGLPLTVGFLSKVALFRAALEGPHAAWVAGALVLSVTFVLAAALRYHSACHRTPAPERSTAFTAIALCGGTVLLGAWAEPVVGLAAEVAARIAGGAA